MDDGNEKVAIFSFLLGVAFAIVWLTTWKLLV